MKNLFDIKDKVIVITGGCGILGKNIANYLAEYPGPRRGAGQGTGSRA